MAANWQNAYGAIGATDALRQILTDRIAAQKVEEDNRRAQVAEANEAARMAQQAEQFRLSQAARQGEFVSGRDERYQDALRDVRRQDLMTQERATERDINRKTHIDDRADTLGEHQRTRDFTAEQNRLSRAQAERIAGMRSGPDTEGRALAHELAQLKIDAERGKQDTAATAAKTAADTKSAERQGFVSLATSIRDHPNLNRNVGPVDAWIPTVRAGSHDFEAKKAQLIAALSLENRAKLKGSGAISDYEAKTLERAGTSLAAATDEKTFKAELNRLIDEMGPKVTLIAPDGSRQQVPASQADHYVAQGAKVVP